MAILNYRSPAQPAKAVAQRALSSRDARIRAAFDTAPIGLAIATLDGQWLQFNQATCEVLGYRREEMAHISLVSITHPEDAERELVYVRRVLAGDTQRYRIEKRTIDKSGKYRAVQVTATLGRSQQGDPDVFVYLIEEQQPKAESGHDADHLSTQLLGQLTAVAVIRTDARGVITGWNAGAERILGYARDEIAGRNISALHRDEDTWNDKPMSRLRAAAEHGRDESDVWRVTSDGRTVWMHSLITAYAPDGRVRGFIEVLHPPTDDAARIDVSSAVDQLRAKLERERKARSTIVQGMKTLRAKLALRDHELSVLASALREAIDGRKSAENALQHEPAIAADVVSPQTLGLTSEDPWHLLGEAEVVYVLHAFAISRRTGAVLFACTEGQKAFFFENGRMTSCASDNPRMLIAERLERSGTISVAQRRKALEMVEVTNLAFCRAVAILGFADEETLADALREKINAELDELLTFHECRWATVDREPPHTKMVQLSLDVRELRAMRSNPLRLVATATGTKFHVATCTTLRRAAPDALIVLDATAAYARRLTPCKSCLK